MHTFYYKYIFVIQYILRERQYLKKKKKFSIKCKKQVGKRYFKNIYVYYHPKTIYNIHKEKYIDMKKFILDICGQVSGIFVKNYKVLNFERGNADELHGNLQSMA